MPEVTPLRPLDEAVRALPAGIRLLVLDEGERTERLGQAAGEGPVGLVVGPEGGLAREEVEALRAGGGIPVSLGPLVLRTETAAIAALAVLRHLDGLLG